MRQPQQLSLPFVKLSLEQLGTKFVFGRDQCAYCGRPAQTRDHVPPRCLLEKPFPENLATVASCHNCNAKFSLDEQYFLTVLAQVGSTPSLLSKVEEGGVVDRALNRAPALDDRIIQSLRVEVDGRVSLVPEFERMLEIGKKVAFGLFVRRYGPRVSLGSFRPIGIFHQEQSLPPPIVAAMHYWPGIRRKQWTVVQEMVFEYLFARGWLISDPFYCFINFHNTLLAVVACPDPASMPRNRKGTGNCGNPLRQ